MKALIDGDILRYEIGFAAEAGWRNICNNADILVTLPPWRYVQYLLDLRIADIQIATSSTSYTLYLSEGDCFRKEIATVKPYKGTRKGVKPWHFKNLTVYMVDVLEAKVVQYLEADDALAIDHVASKGNTILCSRDKDLRQVPGLFYSWELGRQPSFGPVEITEPGSLHLDIAKKKLTGTGFAFFCSQLITGDTVDNIPGLPGQGPVAAYNLLCDEVDKEEMFAAVKGEYIAEYGNEWEERMVEQGRLLWMVRRYDGEGEPVIWDLGVRE